MTLEKLEQYLDGALSAEETRAVETAAANDAVLAARIARLTTQRALRQAALSTYSPTAGEAASAATHALASIYAETAIAGRIGWTWFKRVAAVAAVVAIAATSFYAGRTSGTPSRIADNNTVEQQHWIVIADQQTHEFASAQEATDFVNEYNKQAQEQQQEQNDSQVAVGGVL